MKLTNTNSSILQTIRQPTKLDSGNSLIFVYPMIIDKNLDKVYGKALRDFFSVQFVSQIKTSNVLNVTIQASNVGSSSNINQLENAAEQTAQSAAIGLLTKPNSVPTTNAWGKKFDSDYERSQRYEYQEQINQFRQFILNQIHHDPIYMDLNPVISNVTIENLLNIPLILGTKRYQVNSEILFWILLVATGQYRNLDYSNNNRETAIIRMDRNQSFDLIKKFIRNVDINNYYDILTKFRQSIPGSDNFSRQTKYLHSIQDELDKAIKTFQNATNESYFSQDIGISQNNTLSITNIMQDSLDQQMVIRTKAVTLFSSLISNYVVPLVQSVSATLASVDEINITHRVNALTNNLISSTTDMYSILNDLVANGLINQEGSATSVKLDQFSGMCQSNSSISVTRVFHELSETKYGLTQNREKFIEFVEKVNKIAMQLGTHTQALERNLIDLSNDSNYAESVLKKFSNVEVHDLSGIKQSVRNLVKVFHETPEGSIARIFQTYFESDLNAETKELQRGFLNANPGPRMGTPYDNLIDPAQEPLFDKANANNRLNTILNIQQNQNQNGVGNSTVFVRSIASALASITTFMAYYTFFSYLCEFIQEIKAKVESQKKDVLEFPNYCLVVDSKVIESLYFALASKNYSLEKEDEEYNKVKDAKESLTEKAGKFFNTITNTRIPIYKTNKSIPNPLLPTHFKEFKKPTQPETNDIRGFTLDQSDVAQMMRLLNNRLNVPNLIVIDQKSNIIYYKWMYSGGSIGRLSLSAIQTYNQHQREVLRSL